MTNRGSSVTAGNSINVYVSYLPCPIAYHRHDHSIGNTEYHKENIIPKPKNICLYSKYNLQ
jgi:hypothetical protein